MGNELLESLSNGSQVPVVSETSDDCAEELGLQFLQLVRAQEIFDMWDQSSQLVLVDQVEDLIEVTTFIRDIAFAENAERSDEDAGEDGNHTLQSSLTNGIPTENEAKWEERKAIRSAVLDAHQTDLWDVLGDELLEGLGNGSQVPVVSQTSDDCAEELGLQFLQLVRAQEIFDMWDQSSQLVLVDQVEDLIEVTTFVGNITFAKNAERSDEDAGEHGDHTLESSLTNGIPTENEAKWEERKTTRSAVLDTHLSDLGNELGDELLDGLADGRWAPVVSESSENGGEDLVLQFLQFFRCQERGDLRKDRAQLEFIGQVGELAQISFAEKTENDAWQGTKGSTGDLLENTVDIDASLWFRTEILLEQWKNLIFQCIQIRFVACLTDDQLNEFVFQWLQLSGTQDTIQLRENAIQLTEEILKSEKLKLMGPETEFTWYWGNWERMAFKLGSWEPTGKPWMKAIPAKSKANPTKKRISYSGCPTGNIVENNRHDYLYIDA